MAAILVIDEYAAFRQTMEYCLPRLGHRAFSAAGEAEARTVAAAHQVDVILLDIGMPACGGLEVCAALSRDATLGRVPILVLTALITSDLSARARAAGAAELLAKPFRWDELLATVARLIGSDGRAGAGSPGRRSPIVGR